jgi:hypothetical protein
VSWRNRFSRAHHFQCSRPRYSPSSSASSAVIVTKTTQ